MFGSPVAGGVSPWCGEGGVEGVYGCCGGGCGNTGVVCGGEVQAEGSLLMAQCLPTWPWTVLHANECHQPWYRGLSHPEAKAERQTKAGLHYAISNYFILKVYISWLVFFTPYIIKSHLCMHNRCL